MIQKTTASLALLLVLASCDKKQNQSAPGSQSEPGQRTIHSDRESRNTPGTRDKLRTALDAAKSGAAGEERDKAIAEIAWKALEIAPDIAAEAISELSPGTEEKGALIAAYIQKLLEESKSDEAITWADSLGDERDIASARGKIALMLAEEHPDQAVKLLPANSFTAAGADPTAEQVLQNWTAKNPADAVAWATHLPAGEARSAGFKVVFAQWINGDSTGAISWIATQTNPHVHGEALGAVIAVVGEQPDPIRNALLEFADPKVRAEIEQGIAEKNKAADAESVPEPEPTMAPEPEPTPEPATGEKPQAEPEPETPPEPESEPEPEPDPEPSE